MDEKTDTQLVGICGLYCGTCPSYLAPRLGDTAELRDRASRMGLAEEDVICDGCLSEHVAKPCESCLFGFRVCASQHGVTWCFQCSDFPCERLYRFRDAHVVDGISHHESVIDDLSYMGTHGIAKWLANQRAKEKCGVCGASNYWSARVCAGCGANIR